MTAITQSTTDLIAAVVKCNLSIIIRRLKAGADPNTETPTGNSLLHLAALAGSPDILGLLIKHGAEVDSRDKYDKTPLHCAARHGHEEAAKLLIEKGANVNARAHNGSFPLDWAIKFEKLAVADFLQQCGGETGKALR